MQRRVTAASLAAAYASTREVYEIAAAGFDARRPRVLYERRWLDKLLARLRPGPRVVELGCGAGDPIAGYLLAQGCDYVGVDYSAPMLALARARFPDARWRLGDMRDPAVPGERFDAVLSWDGSFHLSIEEQRELLARLPGMLTPRGAVLLTIGDREGALLGTVEGRAVYHASLDPGEYRERLSSLGFVDVELLLRDPSCDEHSLLLASRG